MSFFKDLWSDLVEKRLWPVAAVLAIALVAVPVVLARGGGEEGAPPPPPATVAAPDPNAPNMGAAAAANGAEVVSLADAGSAKAPAPKGAYHDPFAGAARAHAKSTQAPEPAHAQVAPKASAPSDAPAKSAAAPSTPAAPSTAPSTPATTPTHVTPTPVTRPVATEDGGMRVDVTWGRAGDAKPFKDLVRLGRLDGSAGAIALLFGVRADHKTAVFVLPDQVSAVGDGTCLPKASDCQLLLLQAGESEFFDVTTDAGVTQYELDVDRVARRTVASANAARRWRHRESKLGRKMLFGVIKAGRTAAADFMYKSHLGVLVRQLPGR